MKKTMLSAVFATMLALSLFGCGGAQDQQEQITEPNDTTAVEQETDGAEAPEESASKADASNLDGTAKQTPEPANESAAAEEAQATPESPETNTNFAETTLVDDDNCSIKILSIDPNGTWGYTLKAELENKSDTTLMFSVDNAAIDGCMADPFFGASVTPGSKAIEDISWDKDALEKIGVDNPSDIALALYVFDDEDWAADPVIDETYHVYPLGEENAAAVAREAGANDQVLFDTDKCSMVVTGIDPAGTWGYTLEVYLVNKTDTDVIFAVDDASVNGVMCDPFWATDVLPGCVSYAEISWFDDALAEKGLSADSIESIQMAVRVYDDNDWTAEDFANESVTIEP